MKSIPQQYIFSSDYPQAYLNREDELECQLKALELQYDRWVDDLLGRIVDLEDEIEDLRSTIRQLDHTLKLGN